VSSYVSELQTVHDLLVPVVLNTDLVVVVAAAVVVLLLVVSSSSCLHDRATVRSGAEIGLLTES